MIIGVLTMRIHMNGIASLKEKRSIVKSLIERLKSRFNVSVAEVDDQNLWQLATIGVCCVSNSSRHTNEVLSKVVDSIVNGRFDVEILNYEIELLSIL